MDGRSKTNKRKLPFYYSLIFSGIIFLIFSVNEWVKNRGLSEFEKMNLPVFDVSIFLMSVIFGLIAYFIINFWWKR